MAVGEKVFEIKLLTAVAVRGRQKWRQELTYTSSGSQDLSGNKRPAEQPFHQNLMKANRGFTKRCYCSVNEHKEANTEVRRRLFVFCKVGGLQNIR